MGTRFPAETGFLAAILKHNAVKTKLVNYQIGQRYFGGILTSVTVHINIISCIFLCWAYYGPPALSLLTPQQLLLKMKLDLDPKMKVWYKLLYYMMGGINMKLSVQV